jgi:hypothetical protein
MDQSTIVEYISKTFSGVDVVIGTDGIAAGDTFFIYDPNRNLDDKQRFPFATIVTKDYGDFDNASNLNRPDVFRLNIGLAPETFRSLFGARPSAPGAAGEDDTRYDYTVLDQLLPHPVYAGQSFVCVLNPSAETFEQVIRPLLAEAYARAARRQSSRQVAREK